jgi:hypothetical protein
MSQNENNEAPRDREDLNDINEEASQADAVDTIRRGLRGDETKGDPDERDVVGGVRSADTPQGREEAKNDRSEKANRNG